MSVPIQEAAEALVPVLSAGADTAVRELAGRAGSSFPDAALRLISKIRGSLKSPTPDAVEVEEALRTGLADGTVSPSDIRALVSNQSSGRDSWGISVGTVNAGNNVNIGSTFHKGDHEE